MVWNRGAILYREARLNVEPAFPGSTIAFTLPAGSLSTFGSRTAAKRTVFQEKSVDQDEETFSRRHLATDGSLYFRQHHAYPRSFLWRVLDNRKTLEIQSVDFEHDSTDKLEANLSLLFQFPSPIRPFCVAFAEPTDRDALTIYAITTANDLYVLTIHREFFCNPAASEQDIETWCKRSEPALFSGRTPYRLVAVAADELLVALDDGAICRMHWDAESKSWDGSRYQHSNWSVRGLLSWKTQPTVRFANADLAVSAAAAMAMSPNRQHILSVCLDHTIRAWNVATGKLDVHLDLLDQTGQAALEKAGSSYAIGPSQSTLMAVIPGPPHGPEGGLGGAQYHVVTYSPKQHRFMFWGVEMLDNIPRFYNICQDADLTPPIDELMNTTVWTLEEFHVIPGPRGWNDTEVWIRARSGPSSRVYSLKFDPSDDHESLTIAWKYDWTSVDPGPLTVEALKDNPANPSRRDRDNEQNDVDLVEHWLDFLFYPGRFTTASLESALTTFKNRLDNPRSNKLSSRGSLKERICAAVATLASTTSERASDADQFEDAIVTQWQAFYGLVKGLHKRRGESLSLAYDRQAGAPWLVLSGHLAAVRSCSAAELSIINAVALPTTRHLSAPIRKALDKPDFRDVARLLDAAASFRKRLPSFVQQEIERQIEMDVLQSRSLTIVDRMEWVESHSELVQHVSDEDLSLLVEELGTEVRDLSTETFLRAIQTLGYEEAGRGISRRQIARFGLQALLQTTQETLEKDQNVLMDLLVLVLFVFVEQEGETPEEFDASEIFVELITRYKDYMAVSWLASKTWAHQTATGPASTVLFRTLSEDLKVGQRLPLTQTVLEGIYGESAIELPLPKNPKTDLLTHWSRAWMASVLKMGYEGAIEDTMSKLLSQREYDLALDFSKFLAESNWATYLKARLHIALGENTLASICFQKAAFSLALGHFNVEDSDTAGLVSEAERNSFSEGLASYYGHVIGLFEKVKAYSYVADFARLGLGSLAGREKEELRTELLQRLFTASIQTSRFEEAYSAMVRHSNGALKHSALQALITSMVAQQQTTQLLKLPFVDLADEVDDILSSLCHKTLNLAQGPPYHQILYSFRISRNNFRGAASILYERLQRLKTTSSKYHDPTDESLTQCYLMIINTLSSVSKEDAYILADQRIDGAGPPQWGIGQGKKLLKRQIVTLETLRKEYQAELDRVAAIEGGQYPFVDNGDEMEIL